MNPGQTEGALKTVRRLKAGHQRLLEFEGWSAVVWTLDRGFNEPLIEDGEARGRTFSVEGAGVAIAGERGHEGRVTRTERTFLVWRRRLARRRRIVPACYAAMADRRKRNASVPTRQDPRSRLGDDVARDKRGVEQCADERERCAYAAVQTVGRPQSTPPKKAPRQLGQ